MIRFTVPGEPRHWRAPMVTRRGISYSPKAQKQAQTDVRWAAQIEMDGRPPLDGPVSVEITAYRSKGRPKTKIGRERAERGLIAPITRPDASNYAKLTEDALSGVVYLDDSQVVDLTVRKRYSSQPRTEIVVREWNPVEPELTFMED